MTKELFLFELTQQLINLPKEERDRSREFYSEMIADRMEDGMEETDAVAALGDPVSIARGVIQSYRELSAALPAVTPSPSRALRSVSIEDPSGNIEVKPGATNGAYELQYEHCSAESYSLSEENGELVIRYIRGRTPEVRFSLFNIASNERKLTLLLSSDVEALNVRTSSGDIEVENLNVNCLSLSSASGDMAVHGVHCAGEAALTSASGDMHLNALTAARLETHTVSGDLRFDSVSASEIADLETRSGDVSMHHFESDSLLLETLSGDFDLNALAIAHGLKLSAVSGDIELCDCKAVSCAIKTVSGDVKLDEARFSGALEATLTSGDCKMGNASADQIHLLTVSGDLRLDRTQVNRDLTARSQAGDLALNGVTADKIALSTNKGDIQGTLCAIDGGYDFRAKSSAGNVRTPDTRGEHIVEASTSSGDISLSVQ